MGALTPNEMRDLLLSVGTHRAERRLSPLEVTMLIQRMLDSGISRKECASSLGISVTQVSTFLALLSLDPQLQHLADWNGSRNASVPFSTLSEIAKLPSSVHRQVVDAVLRYEFRWKEVVQLVQISMRSREPISSCVRQILALRERVETQHLFVGRISSHTCIHLLRDVSQETRDQYLREAVAQLVGSNYAARSRLGLETFTVLSSHDLPRMCQLSPDEFEQRVNGILEESIT